jgi:hypothetical protein
MRNRRLFSIICRSGREEDSMEGQVTGREQARLVLDAGEEAGTGKK